MALEDLRQQGQHALLARDVGGRGQARQQVQAEVVDRAQRNRRVAQVPGLRIHAALEARVGPEEAEAVKIIFQHYAGGGWSLSKLAAWLNEGKFHTRNKGQLTDGNGKTGHMVYDDYGNVISATDALGNTASAKFDDLGEKFAATDARGTWANTSIS